MDFVSTFELSNKMYDKLKYIVQIILPALATFVGVIGLAVNWGPTELVVVILTATATMLGTILGKSSRNYEQH